MKRLLTVLVLLLPLLTFGQSIPNPRTVVRSCETCTDILYYVTVTVPAYTYPATKPGRITFQRDILLGKFDLYTDRGVKIPKGTRPPRIEPTGNVTTPGGSTVAAGPTWASARYSLTNNLLYVEGAGSEIARLKFERADGAAFSGTNPDNVTINSGTFYGYGANNGQGVYDRQWRASFTPAIAGVRLKFTFERTTGETFGYTFTPVAGADRTILFQSATTTSPGGGSTTGTTPTTPTVPNVSYMLVLGNSITLSGPLGGTNWTATRGMAATADDKDYVHVLQAKLRAVNPGAVVVAKNQGSAIEKGYNNPNDADVVMNNVNNLNSELSQQYPGVKFPYFVLSISENIDNPSFNPDKFRAALDYIIANIPLAPNAQITLRNSVWSGKETSNTFLQNYAVEKGYQFADMSPIRENPLYMNTGDWNDAGVKHHPNDAGMARMAEIILSAMQSTTPVVSPPTSGAVPTLAGGWAEGTLSQLFALAPFVPTNNQIGSWAPNTEQLLSNDWITIGIRNSIGGTLTRTVDKRWGFNMINTNSFPGPRGQYGTEDTGRSEDFSAYGHPNGGPVQGGHPYVQNGHTTAKAVTGDDTGYNPVPGGSRSLYRPRVDWFERQTVNGREVMYTRTSPYHWSILEGEISQSRRHAWHWLEGRIHKWVYLYENYRTDNQAIYEGRQQEGPFSYAIGNQYRQFVSFASNGIDATEITMPMPYVDNQTDTGDKLTSGCWIGAYDSQDRGYALIAPYCSKMGGKQFITQSGDEFSNESGYICVRTTLDFDTPTNFMVSGSKHVGTRSELADYLRANPVDHRPFRYNFSGGLFQGWSTIDGPLRRINGEAVFGLGAPKGYNPSERGAATLSSPFGHFVAAQMPVLYLNMAVTGTAQVRINFLKVNQAEGEVYPNGQYKVINVTGDGQYRTYAVDMSGVPSYSGIICQFYFQNPIGYSPSGSETIKLGWFNTQNQRP